MTAKNRYLLWFANENVDFRLPEVESILEMFKIDMKWIKQPDENPFWEVEFKSEEDARKLASRSVTLRSILKLWGSGETVEELHRNVRGYPPELFEQYLNSSLSYRVEVVTFGKTFTMKEKVEKIETFNYLPANGPVRLNNPDVSLFYIEYYGLDQQNVPENPYSFYFGVWVETFCSTVVPYPLQDISGRVNMCEPKEPPLLHSEPIVRFIKTIDTIRDVEYLFGCGVADQNPVSSDHNKIMSSCVVHCLVFLHTVSRGFTLHSHLQLQLEPDITPDQPISTHITLLTLTLQLTDGQRALISKYSLKTRKFIGNTTMDPQLAFIMANQALVKAGDLVMDPFVGTGSLLVAAAHFGAYVLGVDIDYLMLHGKSRPTRKQDRMKPRNNESVYANMKQYGTESQYLDVVVGDSSLPLWHERLKFDSIITDPPYGIREATEKIGTTRDYKISEHHLKGHIPSKIKYCLDQIFMDLLTFSVRRLKLKGRLVSWIPVLQENYSEAILPRHPCLRLLSNCEQSLNNHTSRRLLTWEKIKEIGDLEEVPRVSGMFPTGFRKLYFGNGETRKERKMRVAQELREKGVNYCPRRGKNTDR